VTTRSFIERRLAEAKRLALKTAAGLLWGLLVGGIFLHPIFGLVGAPAAGLISGALADSGIDEE